MNPIREQRLQRGMTQNELARLLGVDRSNVAKWETGVHKPRADMLLNLSRVFQCSLDELLGRGGGASSCEVTARESDKLSKS